MKTIKSCTSSKDAWDKLSSMHNVKNMARVIALNNQLKDLKMTYDQTITEHVAKITDLRDQLANVDEEIEEQRLVSITLNSLAPSHSTFATSLSTTLRAAPISFEELVGLLLQEEERAHNFSRGSHGKEQALAIGERGKF